LPIYSCERYILDTLQSRVFMIFPNTNLITYSTSYSSILERSYNCTSSLDSYSTSY
jgi:hypothetical protein